MGSREACQQNLNSEILRVCMYVWDPCTGAGWGMGWDGLDSEMNTLNLLMKSAGFLFSRSFVCYPKILCHGSRPALELLEFFLACGVLWKF